MQCVLEMQEMGNTKQFTELLHELENCSVEEQKLKIFEMNQSLEEMDAKKFDSILTEELYLFLGCSLSSEPLSICVSCLLKVALDKKKDEDTQKMKVEMALLALSRIAGDALEQELFLNDIKQIIRNHQEHHNLTRLAYQSAWQFLINQLVYDENLDDVIANELHFAREARRELKELSNCMDWNRKEEEMSKEVDEGKTRIEAKEIIIMKRWLDELEAYFRSCKLWNEEFVGLLGSIVEIFREARDNHKVVSCNCIESLEIIT
ncbi:uncharacterized protein MONOS_17243 [Monocercomonoides exilis]|uniref:uncharacterized protein n=1 Tax=Monocercomonoides exilis TaxID=2049356 RepID=UPI003559BFB0|nr:hypothetical protein MONOS_17243 [Monocercomonoides exilis]